MLTYLNHYKYFKVHDEIIVKCPRIELYKSNHRLKIIYLPSIFENCKDQEYYFQSFINVIICAIVGFPYLHILNLIEDAESTAVKKSKNKQFFLITGINKFLLTLNIMFNFSVSNLESVSQNNLWTQVNR